MPDSGHGLDGRVGVLESSMNRVLGIIDGRPGEKGLKQEFNDFFTWSKTRDEEKKIYESRTEKKQNLMLAIATVVLAIGSLIILILGYEHETHHALISNDPVSFTATQNAILE